MKYLISILLLMLSVFAFSQQKSDTDSTNDAFKIIRKAIKLEDSAKYQQAINELDKVSKDDSNYVYAQYEKCVALEADSQFVQVIQIAKKWLQKYNKEENQFYNLIANTYDILKQCDTAQFYYNEAIKKYPADYLLYYNLAISYYNSKKIDKAVMTLEKSIQLNIYHATSHLMLGTICARQGKFAQAMMALEAYLLIEPNGSQAKSALIILSNISNNKVKMDSVKTKRTNFEDEIFSDINLIIKSGIALNAGLKTGVRINDPIISQTKVLIDKLPERNDSTAGFFITYYAPLFNYFKKKPKAFEPYMMYIASSVSASDEKIKKYIKHNSGKISNTLKALNGIFLYTRYKQRLWLNENKKLVSCTYYDDNRLHSYGKVTKKGKDDYARTGLWHFYGKKGNLNIVGSYDQKGNKHGKWQYFNDDGSLNMNKTKDY